MTLHNNIKRIFLVFTLIFVAILVVGCNTENEAEALLEDIAFAKTENVNGSFPLPKFVKGNQEAPITWTSDNEVIKVEEYPSWDDSFRHDLYVKAGVTLAKDATDVTLTATVTYKEKQASKAFLIKVVGDDYEAMTIAAAKAAALNTKVKLRGIVSFVSDGGYVILAEDKSEQMFVYQGSGFKVGDVVIVRGTTAIYNKMPQLASGSAAEKVDQVTFNAETEATKMTLNAAMKMDPSSKSTYSKLIQIEGIVEATTDTNKPYKIYNPVDGRDFLFVSKYTSKKSLEALAANVGKYVKVNTIVYDHRDNFINILMPDSFTGVDYVYDAEKYAQLTLTEMQSKFEGALVTGNLTLPTAVETRGATIAWESSNTAIIKNDGKVTLPNQDTKVTLSITVTVGEKTATGTVEVNVKKLDSTKVNKLLEMTPAKSDAASQILVAVEGVVVGHQYKGYWVADETGAILIYTNQTSGSPAIGSVVKVVGKLTTYGESNSFTSQIAPSSVEVIEGATAPTTIAPVVVDLATLVTNSVDSLDKAKTLAKTYYGKYITITGKLTGSGNYWKIEDPNDATKFFRLNNLASNSILLDNAGKIYTITVMVRDFYFINDASGYNNYYAGTVGGIFFAGNANMTEVK